MRSIRKSLYEVLPTSYVILGVFGLYYAQEVFGKICGFALITSGLYIKYLRINYRRCHRERRELAEREGLKIPDETPLEKFTE